MMWLSGFELYSRWAPLDWLTCFPDSKAKDFGFHKQKISGIRNRNPDSGFPHVGRLAVSSFSNCLLDD